MADELPFDDEVRFEAGDFDNEAPVPCTTAIMLNFNTTLFKLTG